MSLVKPSEMHKRRAGLNKGVGLALAAFIALVFGLTVVKVGNMEFTSPPGSSVPEVTDGD